PMVDEEIGDPDIIKPFPAGISDVERDLHACKEFDQIGKFRVAARVPAAADGHPFDIAGHHLKRGKRLFSHLPQTFPSLVVFTHAPAAVITSHPIGGTVAASKGGDFLHMLKI